MSVGGRGCDGVACKVGVRGEERSAGEPTETLGGALGVGNGGSEWRVRTDYCIRLCQPRFRHPYQPGHLYQCNRSSSLGHAERKQRLWMIQEHRCWATNRWRGMKPSLGARNPKVVKPGGNYRLLHSSLYPSSSNLLCIFHQEFERQSKEESECMLRPDLRASVLGHQRKRSKRTTRAIRRASATHYSGRNPRVIESSSEKIRRRLVRGRERRGRVGSDSRCGG